jgi:hypothetical protein
VDSFLHCLTVNILCSWNGVIKQSVCQIH